MTTEVLTAGQFIPRGETIPLDPGLQVARIRSVESRDLIGFLGGSNPDFLANNWSYVDRLGGILMLVLARTTWETSGYIDYDGAWSPDPVNQWPKGQEWLTATARFAHQLTTDYRDDFHLLRQQGTHTLGPGSVHAHTEESTMRARNVLWWGRGMVGLAFRDLTAWMALESHITAATPDDQNWKLRQPAVDRVMAGICAACGSGTWVRQFAIRHDPLAFRSTLNNGQLCTPNMASVSASGWPPQDILLWMDRNNRTEQWDDLIGWYAKAVDYFDDHVGDEHEH